MLNNLKACFKVGFRKSALKQAFAYVGELSTLFARAALVATTILFVYGSPSSFLGLFMAYAALFKKI
ncbi:hypothetical protein [Rufibacter roseus]|uniref:Uncharacterized protein n=1 Tax=Rufibacter roseus TaxID=1567108 RepID=A0ABW2DKA1_9BACT|nr:hypothetical protein [Rufibacter roseus]